MSRKLTIKLTCILSTIIIKVIAEAEKLATDMQAQGVKIGLDWILSEDWKARRGAIYQQAVKDLTRAVAIEIAHETIGIQKGVEDE